MGERIMKNFPFEVDGQTYWRSRSVAVVGFVFCRDKDGTWCVLANQRGAGCPDENFKWNAPCGFLDFDENGNEAVVREIFEETGVELKPEQMVFDSVSFSKKKDQNVTLRYVTVINDRVTSDFTFNDMNSEVNEIACIKWVPFGERDTYDWAFGHEELIPEMFYKHVPFMARQLHID